MSSATGSGSTSGSSSASYSNGGSSLYRRPTYNRSTSGSGGSSTTINTENLPPRTLQRVAREVRDLHKNPPEGIRLVVDTETGMPCNLGEVTAELRGPIDTPFENKYFQLKLVLSSDFPSVPPRGYFITKIYHPNVDYTTGAICVNTLKKDWTPETSFKHVLSIIRCLLIVPFPESSLNDEAGKLFMESYDEYAKRARLMANVHGKSAPFDGCDDENDSKKIDGGSSSPTSNNENGSNNVVVVNTSNSNDSPSKKQKGGERKPSVGDPLRSSSGSSSNKKNKTEGVNNLMVKSSSLRASGSSSLKSSDTSKKSKKKGLKRL